MNNRITYIWQQKHWPNFTWDDRSILVPLGECRLAQGKFLARVDSLGLALIVTSPSL